MKDKIQVQTRSEKNGLCYFDSFNKALAHAIDDETVWKISYTIPETGERVRLVKEGATFVLEGLIPQEELLPEQKE